MLARDYGFDGNPSDQYRDDDLKFTGVGNRSEFANINVLWYIVGAEAVVVALILYFAFIF